MTKQRYDSHSTEFGLWLREQEEIDSNKGYTATNIDYLWHNWKNGKWMLIEEKRYGSEPKSWQKRRFDMLDRQCRDHDKYKGFHYITFENTSPDDGWIELDGERVTKEELIAFLEFSEGDF